MNNSDILPFYHMLGHTAQTELRAINPETKEVKSIHLDNEETLLKICNELDTKYNIYLGVNERKPFGTKREEVIKVKVIPIDIDCIHKPATDEDIMVANSIVTQMITD